MESRLAYAEAGRIKRVLIRYHYVQVVFGCVVSYAGGAACRLGYFVPVVAYAVVCRREVGESYVYVIGSVACRNGVG